MSCSESWDISRSRYPESTSVAFSKSAWLFCKDKKKKSIWWGWKRFFFFFNPSKISSEIKSRIRYAPCNTLVTCSEHQDWKSWNFFIWSEENLHIYQQVLCLPRSAISCKPKKKKILSLLVVAVHKRQFISHSVPCLFFFLPVLAKPLLTPGTCTAASEHSFHYCSVVLCALCWACSTEASCLGSARRPAKDCSKL